MRRYRWLTFPLVLFLAVGCAAPQATRPDRLTFEPLEFQVPEVEKIELPSGIRLYFKEDHELPLVSVTAMVGAGSISVPEEIAGMAEIFAALLRTGGAGDLNPTEVDELLALLAADLNVRTDTYTTNFNLSLRTEDFGKGMAVLADMLRRPGFDSGRLEIARRQSIEAVRRQNDEPDSVASRALLQAVYGDHPLGRWPTVESLKNIERQNLLDFHDRYFHPNNLWIAVSGDINREELLALLEREFQGWPVGTFADQVIPPVETPQTSQVLVAEKDVPQTTILIGELGIDKDDPMLFPVRVMNFILGGSGFNSRLMREIRSNRGLAYSVYSYFQIGRRLPGPFIAGTETKAPSTLEAARLMRDIIENMRQKPVSDQELALAKDSLIHSFVFGFTDTHDVVTQRMTLDYFDYPEDYLETYRDRIAAVTAEEVLTAARKYLHPDRQTIVLVGDVADFDDSPSTLELPVRRFDMDDEGRFETTAPPEGTPPARGASPSR